MNILPGPAHLKICTYLLCRSFTWKKNGSLTSCIWVLILCSVTFFGSYTYIVPRTSCCMDMAAITCHKDASSHPLVPKVPVSSYCPQSLICDSLWSRPFYSCVLSDLALKNGSKAGDDLVLIQTTLFLLCNNVVCSLITLQWKENKSFSY